MTALTTARQHPDDYALNGFAGPVKAFDPAELRGAADAVLQELQKNGGSMLALRNRHFDWPLVQSLIAARPIVEQARQILGPELMLWRTQFFVGSAGGGLGWHRDVYKTLLADSSHYISIHLAITDAPEDNCLLLVPGSHKKTAEALAGEGFNLNPASLKKPYGNEGFWRNPDRPSAAVKMTLRAGEFFLFHPRLLHASYDVTAPPGSPRQAVPASTERRVGLGIRITIPGNEVFPAAFAETAGRGNRCVILQ